MPQTRILKDARAAFENGAWSDAPALLVAADAAAPLDADDLERLAVTAYLTGDEAKSLDARTRAHAARASKPIDSNDTPQGCVQNAASSS